MNWPEAFFALGIAYLLLKALSSSGPSVKSARYSKPKDKYFVPEASNIVQRK